MQPRQASSVTVNVSGDGYCALCATSGSDSMMACLECIREQSSSSKLKASSPSFCCAGCYAQHFSATHRGHHGKRPSSGGSSSGSDPGSPPGSALGGTRGYMLQQQASPLPPQLQHYPQQQQPTHSPPPSLRRPSADGRHYSQQPQARSRRA